MSNHAPRSTANGEPVPAGGRVIGRYRLFGEIAAGGMATVHVGRLVGPGGFSRTVAIKRLHPQFAKDPDFVAMFMDEARLAARIRHPNVASILDVVQLEDELFLVMEYVQGESLSRLLRGSSRRGDRAPPARVVSAIIGQALLGLHAAHDATTDQGAPLGIVHRDVSPQNILVGTDGISRVVDFGVAKAQARSHTTREGQLKGKLGYMAPEQLEDRAVDRRTDVFTAGIVLWEALTGQRLFVGNDPGSAVAKILNFSPPPPSRIVPSLDPAVDEVVLRALAKKADARFSTTREMAAALEAALPPAGALEVGAWVETVAATELDKRARRVREVESVSSSLDALAAADRADPPSSPSAASGPRSAGESEARSGLTVLSVAAGHSTPAPPRERAKSRVFVVIGAAAAGGVIAIAAYRLATGPRAAGADVEPVTAASPPALVTAAPAPVPPPTPAPAPAPASASGEAVPPSEPINPAPLVSAREKSSRAASSKAKKPVQSAPGAKPNCDPPYVLDATGAKRFKPECF